MSPKVPQAYLDARREEIIDAAVKCFLEKGFHNTTMQDIYDATSLSPGAVYNYFSSKEDIVVSALKRYTEWSVSSITPIITRNLPDTLAKCLEFWLSSLKEYKDDKSFSTTLDFYSEATRNSSIHQAVVESQDVTHEAVTNIIKQNQQKGLINPELDPLSIARLIGGMIFGIAIHKMLDPGVDVDDYSKVCQAMLNGTFVTQPDSKN